MIKKIILTLSLVGHLYADQKIILPGIEPSYIILDEKYLILEKDSKELDTTKINNFFKSYNLLKSTKNIDGIKSLYVQDDPYLASLNRNNNFKVWFEKILPLPEYDIIGYLVDKNKNTVDSIVYTCIQKSGNRDVSFFSTVLVNGDLKIKSNTFDANSPLYILKEWWIKNYPKNPIIENETVAVDKVYKKKFNPTFIIIASIVLFSFVIMICLVIKLRRR